MVASRADVVAGGCGAVFWTPATARFMPNATEPLGGNGFW